LITNDLEQAFYLDDESGFSWRVETLWRVAEDYEQVVLPLDSLIHNLRKPQWGSNLTPMDALSHINRILKADLEYPILVYKKNNKLEVCDGIHRLCAYHMTGTDSVVAKLINLPMPDFAGVHKR